MALPFAPALALASVLALFGSQSAWAWDAAQMARAAEQRGPSAVAALGPLQALLRSSAARTDLERVRTVNAFYNQRIVFATDREVWGQEDYWASPLQTLAQGRGDCEDYAIAKYATLLAAGVAPGSLRLVYVRARIAGLALAQPHMVLTWQSVPDADPLVLDNLRPEVLPAAQRTDLTPLFSFNAEGLWQDSRPAGDPMARLSRWREVWQRTREEGFP
ncbi:MAG: transglutaminase-like cysteine peptidase [Pseudomonadota bacterium]|nr:transglutaminase-like cysteine peptidase [Pseudomonadota bacterium]